MATLTKIQLSASPDGDGLNVTTASPIDGSDTTIHTAVSGTSHFDEVTLYAYNDHTSAVVLHLKWGDSTDTIKLSVPAQSGLVPIVVGLLISDGNTITASAATVDVITIYGSAVQRS
jgi:hypothetical protein